MEKLRTFVTTVLQKRNIFNPEMPLEEVVTEIIDLFLTVEPESSLIKEFENYIKEKQNEENNIIVPSYEHSNRTALIKSLNKYTYRPLCPICESENIIKKGEKQVRENKIKINWMCSTCKKRFVTTLNLE